MNKAVYVVTVDGPGTSFSVESYTHSLGAARSAFKRLQERAKVGQFVRVWQCIEESYKMPEDTPISFKATAGTEDGMTVYGVNCCKHGDMYTDTTCPCECHEMPEPKP